MSFQTLSCVLCAPEPVRRIVWGWTERYTLLVNELLDRVAADAKFSEWQEKGVIPEDKVKTLLTELKGDAQFQNLPGRLYSSAITLVQQTYSSWLALQRQRHRRLTGKQRWLAVLEADLELANTTDFDWQIIRAKAFEIGEQVLKPSTEELAQPNKRKSKKANTKEPKAKQSPLSTLFERYAVEKDPLNCRAIAYLIRNNLEIKEQEEAFDTLILRFEKKRIEIERLEKQLAGRKPKGRDPLGKRFEEGIRVAVDLPQHAVTEEIETEFNTWKPQRQIQLFNTLHYPILFGSVSDLFWSVQPSMEELKTLESEPKKQSSKKRRCKKKRKKSVDRICVNFNGFRKFLSQSGDVFKVQCDRRQLPILQQIVSDWQAYHQLPDEKKYSLGLMVLKTAQLLWKKDDQKVYKKASGQKTSPINETRSERTTEPWQSHRLYLHFTIDPRLLTAEGTETVRQEKITETAKKLDGLQKAKTEQLRKDRELGEESEDSAKKQKNRENKISASTTSLACLQQPTPERLSKPPYQAQPHILVGISFSRERPVGIAVMDMTTQKVVEYQSVKQLLSNRTIRVKRGDRSAMQLRLEKYRLIDRHHRQQQQNAVRRRQEQKQNRYAKSKAESSLGEYIDRLLASRIVKLALKWQASSIALPKIGDIRESVESDIKAKAEHKFPNEFKRQQRYAKHFRSSIHRWSYSRLTDCIKSCASRVPIPVEQGQQPAKGALLDKAVQVALSAYYTREAPKS